MTGTRLLVAKRLRTLRGSDSQASIAAVAGVSPATVSNWESATHEIGAESLARLAKHWRVSVDYLLGMTDNATPPARKRAQRAARSRKAQQPD